MKVYIKKESPVYDRPEDMAKILEYLAENGTLQVSGTSVERFYREFSHECYCAGWMSVREETLAEFADWLAEIDI